MTDHKISIIGCGNIGISMLEGFLSSQEMNGSDIIITRRNISRIGYLKNSGVILTTDNRNAVKNSNIVIIAVKPYDFTCVLKEIAEQLCPPGHLLISVTAGITISQIREQVPDSIPVFRVMPNISASVANSISCICSDRNGSKEREQVESLFRILGTTMFIEEELMKSATILGACGIAFTLRFIRAMIQAGVQIGFDSDTAGTIVTQTVGGAAKLLSENRQHPEFEIDKVTTPKGCTIVGLNEMEHNGFSSSLIKGIVASFEKCG